MPISKRGVADTKVPAVSTSAVTATPVTTTDTASNRHSKSAAAKRNYSGHSKALPIDFDLARPGHVRVGHWLTAMKWSHSKFYAEQRKKT